MNEINQKLYAILIDQLLPDMHPKIEGTTGHEQVDSDQDWIDLLATIKKITYGVEEFLQKTMAIVMAKKTLHMFWKNTNVANDDYKIQFDTYVTILEAYTGRINVPPDLVDGKLRELYPSLSDPKNAL